MTPPAGAAAAAASGSRSIGRLGTGTPWGGGGGRVGRARRRGGGAGAGAAGPGGGRGGASGAGWQAEGLQGISHRGPPRLHRRGGRHFGRAPTAPPLRGRSVPGRRPPPAPGGRRGSGG